MPHGLSIDQEDNVWITDVALHQVFKFGPRGFPEKPLLVLGKAFRPGTTDTKFCKPTAVAVLESGDFFVAVCLSVSSHSYLIAGSKLEFCFLISNKASVAVQSNRK
ncbi:hypothetical protein GQX74_015249 [Glossina fuscipes]|nr:hypothetical protein GQX74_015249 [Glossina fuscipes]